jgi:hypothetical protein
MIKPLIVTSNFVYAFHMVVEYQITFSLKYINIGYVCAVCRMCAVDLRSVIKNSVDNTYSYAVLHYRT